MCPFCYIGKRRFENALEQFAHKDDIQIEWRSFQLDPDMQYVPGKNINEVLADKKGWTVEEARQMNQRVSDMARQEGLEYNMEQAIPANTLDAHRLTHLAAKHGLQDQAEERLFSAYFTEGKNIGDKDDLIRLGREIGLTEEELHDLFETDAYAQEVLLDCYEAQQIGVRGVPFFVLDRKYAVSGAQSSNVFLEALKTAWKEYENENTVSSLNASKSNSCSIDGNC
jgi:predicted DsbA family dithiol-disulfide isomerase